MHERFRSEILDARRHRLDAFRCGEPSLDDWLRASASGAAARRVASTVVWCPDDGSSVVAYYSLAAHRLARDGLPRRVGHGSPAEAPSVLLARLALSRDLQGEELGGVLLADAMERVVGATAVVAARFVVVDALHDRAAAFYEHHGFRRIPGTGRLVRKVSDVARSLAP